MSDVSAIDPEALARWRQAVPDAPADVSGEGFAIGWFGLCESGELGAGEVIGVRRFAQKLVVWRGEDGIARALPARCAHAGVDMSAGGKVHGDWIECPFHNWRWDETGALREVPYSIKPIVQKTACRTRWPLCETGAEILVWHHPDRIDPLWQPASLADPAGGDAAVGPVATWQVAAGLAALRAAAAEAPNPLPIGTIEADGRIATPLSFAAGGREITGEAEAVAQGAGRIAIGHSAVPGAMLCLTLAPVDHALTEVRLAVASAGPDMPLAQALAQAVARAIDRIKTIADVAPAG